jgi:CMP-N,N'-diacetyllegionaminic acid synthase
MKILAIIPARGGSKGIKRKNLALIEDKPLLAFSIEHALQSKKIDRVIVSTEDAEIAEVALNYGAEVPFMRPDNLAEDHVLDFPVFEHVLDELRATESYTPDIVVHLRPTAPIRKIEWIDEAIDLLINNSEADSVRSVSEPSMHPYRMFDIDKQGYLDPIMKHCHTTPYLLRRQDLPIVYFYNCVIDVTKPETLKKLRSMTGDKILPYILNPDEVFDIDTQRDLDIIRQLAKKYI